MVDNAIHFMNGDEFAFFNQQLAAMVRDGIPLEGALRQLTLDMRSGKLRSELELLENDLALGIPLNQSLEKRDMPPLYVQMVQVGVKGNDLAGVLLLLADYYRQVNSIWTRLKGLMVYPVIVLTMALVLSVALGIFFGRYYTSIASDIGELAGASVTSPLQDHAWWLTGSLAALMLLVLVVLSFPLFGDPCAGVCRHSRKRACHNSRQLPPFLWVVEVI